MDPCAYLHKISLSVSPSIGKACLYHDAVFSAEQTNYALIECLGPDIPTSAIYRIFPDEDEHPLQLVKLLINNTRLKVRLLQKQTIIFLITQFLMNYFSSGVYI